jgi:hypothetical protein
MRRDFAAFRVFRGSLRKLQTRDQRRLAALRTIPNHSCLTGALKASAERDRGEVGRTLQLSCSASATMMPSGPRT